MEEKNKKLTERINELGFFPIVVIDNIEDAIPTAKAIYDAGVDVMEITFRTAVAADCIKKIASEFKQMQIGAGTVINVEQCKHAIECGAKFIVTPGVDEETLVYCNQNSIPIYPGCATPTDIMTCLKNNINVVKFFPANVFGGLKALKALSGPFVAVKFVPTGGVNAENLKEYIEEPFVAAVGGSWVCPRKMITDKQFSKITELCLQASEIINNANRK